jgi:hypothetical protein
MEIHFQSLRIFIRHICWKGNIKVRRQYQLLHIIHDVAVWLIQPVFECQPGHVGIKTNQLQYVGIRNPMYVK